MNYATVPTSNDEQIILIDTILNNGSFWGDAKQTNWLTSPPPPYYYNEQYTNENKLQRYLGGIPAPIAAYLNTDANRFRASTTAAYPIPNIPSLYSPVAYDDDSTAPNFDNGGNYDNTILNYDYVVPVTSIFTYVVERMRIVVPPLVINVRVAIQAWNSARTVLKSGLLIYDGTPAAGILDLSGFFGTFYAELGDNIIVSAYGSVDGAAEIELGSVVSISSIGANGGIFADFDPKDYPIIRNQFDYPMSFKEFRTLKAQPLGLLSFGVRDSKTYFAWIEEIKYKHFADTSNFMLISNETTN